MARVTTQAGRQAGNNPVTQVIAHFSNTGYIDLAVPDDAHRSSAICRQSAAVARGWWGGDRREYFFTYHPTRFSDGMKRPPCAGSHELPRIVLEIEEFSKGGRERGLNQSMVSPS